jgi:hypothetical protein
VTGNVTTFFRQGNCITVNAENIEETRWEKITEADLGSMYLIFEEVLVVRSSGSILFFKLGEDTGLWEKYH